MGCFVVIWYVASLFLLSSLLQSFVSAELCFCRGLLLQSLSSLPQTLVSTEDAANLVLETAPVDAVEQSLVDDGEADVVAVGSCEIAAERADTRHGTRLGVDIATCERTLHAAFQCAVTSGDGQSLIEVVVDNCVAVCIAQETYLELRADIVVERKP